MQIIYNANNLKTGMFMENTAITNEAETKYEKKLVQDEYNVNVAFYIHLKSFNGEVKKELNKRIEEVFFFSKGVDWSFDSFGIEKTGSRGSKVLGYFVFRTTNVSDLQKLFLQEFKDYENALKITCSIAEYKKVKEEFFNLEF